MQIIRKVFHCKEEQFLIKYLGIPVEPEKLTKHDWLPLLDSFQKKIRGLEGKIPVPGREGGNTQCGTFCTTTILYVLYFAKVGERKN